MKYNFFYFIYHNIESHNLKLNNAIFNKVSLVYRGLRKYTCFLNDIDSSGYSMYCTIMHKNLKEKLDLQSNKNICSKPFTLIFDSYFVN